MTRQTKNPTSYLLKSKLKNFRRINITEIKVINIKGVKQIRDATLPLFSELVFSNNIFPYPRAIRVIPKSTVEIVTIVPTKKDTFHNHQLTILLLEIWRENRINYRVNLLKK